MQPQDPYSRQRRGRKILAFGAILIVVVGVILLSLSAHDSNSFRLVSTSPDMDNVGTVTPYITFTFNQPLTKDGLSITSKTNAIKSVRVNDKQLIVTLPSSLQLGSSYNIDIGSISSTDGSTITNQTFSFTTKPIPFDSLPKDQQEFILQEQVDRPASKDNYAYYGESSLVDNGATSDQVTALRQALYSYFTAAKINVTDVTYSNIIPKPANPDDPASSSSWNFSLKFGGKTYSGVASNIDLYTVRLYLYDTSGSLVYDSKNVKLQ